mmetsp:Transcript_106908/g.300591  ORF Transcript_106908/g.300591 Transcript_106908/m.300591 type:complete len:619 (-) Transcript_106908:183-2039(-)
MDLMVDGPTCEEGAFEELIQDAPKNASARAAQEAKWAGDYDGRQHWSLREAYRLFRDRLQVAQEDFYRMQALLDGHYSSRSPLRAWDFSILERVADFAFAQSQAMQFLASARHALPERHASITFVARKRPLLSFEVEAGDWDCVDVDAAASQIVCHDGRLHRTGRRLEMTHKRFALDRVYGSACSDEAFYIEAVRPLVQCALAGTEATVICYGQTGTGKTHTFNACWQRVGSDLVGHAMNVTFFEIHGKKCYDLLQQRKEVVLRADASERVHVRGALTLSLTPSSASDLANVLEDALRLRKAEATERNPVSSRSHAVCILDIDGLGTVRFVDLAGSERNYETHYMTAQQHRDFAEINTSLMALKDCFRAHAQLIQQRPARPPYRASRLTQVLRSCFTDPHHKTAILAMVSPTATDLLHSTNSLLQVTQMSASLSALRLECTVDLPLLTFMAAAPVWEWTTEDVDMWIKTVDNGRFKYLVLPPKVTGAALLRLSSQGLADLFSTSLRAARGIGEGEAWNTSAGSAVGSHVGRLLFEAVRKEAMRWPAGPTMIQDAQLLEAQERRTLEEGHDLPPDAERHCEFFFWGDVAPGAPRETAGERFGVDAAEAAAPSSPPPVRD